MQIQNTANLQPGDFSTVSVEQRRGVKSLAYDLPTGQEVLSIRAVFTLRAVEANLLLDESVFSSKSKTVAYAFCTGRR